MIKRSESVYGRKIWDGIEKVIRSNAAPAWAVQQARNAANESAKRIAEKEKEPMLLFGNSTDGDGLIQFCIDEHKKHEIHITEDLAEWILMEHTSFPIGTNEDVKAGILEFIELTKKGT